MPRLLALLLVATLLPAARINRCCAADLPAPRTGTVHYRPAQDESRVPLHFRLDEHDFAFEQIYQRGLVRSIEESLVTFPSPVETPHAENNTVHCEYFRPHSDSSHPGVIVLHILGGDFDLSRLFARHLASHDVAALFLKLPYYGPRRVEGVEIEMISPDLDLTVAAMTQAILDIRRAGAWLASQDEVDADQLGVMGVSLGGITAALAGTAEPRFGKMFLMLAGGDIARIGWDNPEAAQVRAAWEAKGGTLETLIEKIRPIDPVTYGANVHDRQIVMLNGRQDEIIPPVCTEALWESFGRPEITWWDAGHYTAARYLPAALTRVADFFQPDD